MVVAIVFMYGTELKLEFRCNCNLPMHCKNGNSVLKRFRCLI